jgi:hypothetical protein
MMIAAMAAAVTPASILCLESGAATLSGELALGAEAGPLEALGTGAGIDGCAAGPVKATGCAKADGAMLTGELSRPTE